MFDAVGTFWDWLFSDNQPKSGAVDPLYYAQQNIEQRNKTIRTVVVFLGLITGAMLIFTVYKHFTK